MIKYEKLFQEGEEVFGEPFVEFLTFFDSYDEPQARVLDIGCGQGRDALFIARLGHQVVGVELAPTGIAQMMAVARKERLAVEGIVADIVQYEPEGIFDVVLFDRVLHMLADDETRTDVLNMASDHLRARGFMLIADTPKQRGFLQAFFSCPTKWAIKKNDKNFLFAQKLESHRERQESV